MLARPPWVWATLAAEKWLRAAKSAAYDGAQKVMPDLIQYQVSSPHDSPRL